MEQPKEPERKRTISLASIEEIVTEEEKRLEEGPPLIAEASNYLIEEPSRKATKDKKAKLIETDAYNPYYEHYFYKKRK